MYSSLIKKSYNLKYYWIFSILVFVTFSLFGCKGSSEKKFRKGYSSGIITGFEDSTSIEWETTYLDLGIVKRGDDIEIEFPLKNSGDKPLVIDSVSVTCGCTLFEVPEKPIAPGKSDKIRIKFVSSEQPLAEMMKHIFVRANTKGHPEHTLSFKIELTE